MHVLDVYTFIHMYVHFTQKILNLSSTPDWKLSHYKTCSLTPVFFLHSQIFVSTIYRLHEQKMRLISRQPCHPNKPKGNAVNNVIKVRLPSERMFLLSALTNINLLCRCRMVKIPRHLLPASHLVLNSWRLVVFEFVTCFYKDLLISFTVWAMNVDYYHVKCY